MEISRNERLAKAIQQVLGEHLRKLAQQNLKNGIISISKVRLSADLSICRAYLSIFPSDIADDVLKEINVMKPQIRHHISQEFKNNMRKTPEFYFHIDDSLDYVENIEKELRGEGENPLK